MMLRSFPASPWEGLDVPSAVLLGIQRDPGPPLHFGPHRFERLRIVIIDRDPIAGDDDGDFDDDQTDDTEILPRIPLLRRGPLPPARPVHGEILRGEDGALYERFGQRIRPLRALAAGPRGEVLEVETTGDRQQAAGDRGQLPNDGNAHEFTPPPASRLLSPESPRALFPESGHWRVVRFGDFRAVLTPQLAQPERLRDAHWLPCHVQVFECVPPPSREALATAALGEASCAAELLPLTPPLVHALQLAALLPPPARGAARFLHLRLAHDPTEQKSEDGAPRAENREPQTEEKAAPSSVLRPPPPVPSAPPPVTAPALAAAKRGEAGPKTDIPAVFLRDGAFARSREEVFFALARERGFWSALGRRLRRLFRPGVAARDLHPWQVLLSGRSADEQLWAVPPPPGWAHDTSVRAWAQRTLELAGYDPFAMLREWEIYWRRKNY